MKFASIAVVVCSLALMNQVAGQAVNQFATLYSGRDGAGQYVSLTETYVPNLSTSAFDNKANSACVTGVWLFYDNIGYNAQSGAMEYVFGPAGSYCLNFNNLAGRVTSVRFAGPPKNYKLNSLTLFQGDYFQGNDEYTTTDLANLGLDKQVASLILTGSSGWTVYALPNFAGDSVCVYPPQSNNFTPAFVYNMATISLPNNSIRSVRLGCFGRKNVTATAFEANKIVGFSTSSRVADATNVGVHGSNNL